MALMQLFAIVAKQDSDDVEKERNYVIKFLRKQIQSDKFNDYLTLFDEKVAETHKKVVDDDNRNLTSVRDSVSILKICKKVNKTLLHHQKVIVIAKLWEMINVNQILTKQRISIITTVAEVFNINTNEYQEIETLITCHDINNITGENFIRITGKEISNITRRDIIKEGFSGHLLILRVESANLLVANYVGDQDIYLNGLPLDKNSSTILATGTTIKFPSGKPLYYSDIYARFIHVEKDEAITYVAENISFKFNEKVTAIHKLTIVEQQDTLVGIMGASGAGKTTLLNVLSGITKPTTGSITINGLDLYKEHDKLEGTIGYIPQEDLLMENLTVFENLYYNARLCFKGKTKQEISVLVDKTLESLGLLPIKDLKVGTSLNKLISGGQRKRLNIALELIREPSILFVDEPTSGLSSKDSENIMDLFRELSFKGKLVFIVIHQPSSEIYKLFDKVILMDEGGYLVQYGNPIEIISYLKNQDGQAEAERVECHICGNVNPEQIFNVVQAKVVDELGQYSSHRKKSPEEWNKLYHQQLDASTIHHATTPPPKNLSIPKKISQWWIYMQRDLKNKLSNKQYLVIALLEAPLLALILSYIIRYTPDGDTYIFRQNENLPHYIFMLIIVALFIGLTISAEEIFKDRKMLKREAFLNLSKTSYFMSKTVIMLIISAIQAFLFVLIGNVVIDINGMLYHYWFAFFTVAAFSNMLGLNISAAFDEVVTIYILIPLIIIPQLVLGGAMFSFDKMNKDIVRVDKVPVAADMMASKWAYEGLMVNQFVNNRFEKTFYESEFWESNADYMQVYYVPELTKKVNLALEYLKNKETEKLENVVELLKNEAILQIKYVKNKDFVKFENLVPGKVNESTLVDYQSFVEELGVYYQNIFAVTHNKKDDLVNYFLQTDEKNYYRLRDSYHNEAVEDIVTKTFEKHKIITFDNRLVQHVDPIYQMPVVRGKFDFRSHLFAPRKHFMGTYFETFNFNMSIIWLMSISLFISLRFNLFRKLIETKIFDFLNFLPRFLKNKTEN